MTLFLRVALGLLHRMKNPALLPIGMQYVERFLPPGERGLDILLKCAADPSWVTRSLAAKNIGAHYASSPDRGWYALVRLTHDPERFVREGVPLSLAAIAANESVPGIEERMMALARSDDAHVRRAIAYTALVLWRQENCEGLRTALLTEVARNRTDGIGRLLGRRIVAEEVARIDESGAMALVETWAASADPELKWQAQQALQGTLAKAYPQRVARLREKLVTAEDTLRVAASVAGGEIEERE